ncbi:hypothetical protein X743_03825 [Mesorhizobium sp. LNHC252B00]|nr:hypothetical protein X743_03825 [Mesorhizobium sp. LNHC252B00]
MDRDRPSRRLKRGEAGKVPLESNRHSLGLLCGQGTSPGDSGTDAPRFLSEQQHAHDVVKL